MIIGVGDMKIRTFQNRAEFYNCLIERKIKFNDLDKSKYLKIFQDNHIREDSGKWGLAYGRWNSIPNDKKKEIYRIKWAVIFKIQNNKR